AGLLPVRADEEQSGGIIHKPMFERLILCEIAVADLTTANANVFYELGVRHAVKPATTKTSPRDRLAALWDVSAVDQHMRWVTRIAAPILLADVGDHRF